MEAGIRAPHPRAPELSGPRGVSCRAAFLVCKGLRRGRAGRWWFPGWVAEWGLSCWLSSRLPANSPGLPSFLLPEDGCGQHKTLSVPSVVQKLKRMKNSWCKVSDSCSFSTHFLLFLMESSRILYVHMKI